MLQRIEFLSGMATGAAILAAGMVLGGAGRPGAASDVTSVVRTHRIEVVDRDGSVRIALGTNRNGGEVTAFSREGEPSIQLFADAAGGGVIETYRGKAGGPLVSITSTVGGHGQIRTADGNGKPLITLTATADDQGQLYTHGRTGRPLIALASQAGGASLRLYDDDGAPIITMESNEDGNGVIGVWRPDGAGKTMKP